MSQTPIPHSLERFIVILGYAMDIILFFLFIKTDSGYWPFALLLPGQLVVYNYMDDYNKQARCTQHTQARVVDTVRKIGGTLYRRWTRFPVVEFEADGHTYRSEGNDGSAEYRVGDEVWIYYNPDKPTEIFQSFPYANRNVCIVGGVVWGMGILWALGVLVLALI